MPTIMTVDEAVAALARSSLPTIVTEGREDYLFFRRMEEEFLDVGLDIISVGGRHNVLEIFSRRSEIGRNDVFFFVDSDLWLFSGRPAIYQHHKMMATSGYSIENDLYQDGELESLLTNTERGKFNSELAQLLHWYCYAIRSNLSGNAIAIKTHPNQVLTSVGILCQTFCGSINYSAPTVAELDSMTADYKVKLRGKNLMQLLVRQIGSSTRWPKYSYHQLMEISVIRKGLHYKKILSDITSLLRQYGTI